jgi:hypothetical protein
MKKFTIILISIIFIVANCTIVFAANSTATITGQHIVENDTSLKSFNNTFILKSINDAPMPDGSSNGVKEITSLSNEDFSFGDIIFSEAGIYEYKVERNITESKTLKADDSTYLVKIQVHQNGTTSIIFQMDRTTT